MTSGIGIQVVGLQAVNLDARGEVGDDHYRLAIKILALSE